MPQVEITGVEKDIWAKAKQVKRIPNRIIKRVSKI
jgi:hypothetical protein